MEARIFGSSSQGPFHVRLAQINPVNMPMLKNGRPNTSER